MLKVMWKINKQREKRREMVMLMRYRVSSLGFHVDELRPCRVLSNGVPGSRA